MSSAISVNVIAPIMHCHYVPNLNYDLVQFTDTVLGRNGENKNDGSYSVEAVFYTLQGSNISIVTSASSFGNLNVYA